MGEVGGVGGEEGGEGDKPVPRVTIQTVLKVANFKEDFEDQSCRGGSASGAGWLVVYRCCPLLR